MKQENTLEWHVIPEPMSVERSTETIVLPTSGTILAWRCVRDAEFVFAHQIAADLNHVSGGRWSTTTGDGDGDVTLKTSASLGGWSYVLEVSPEGIVITGASLEGVRDGVQTLRQIIRQTGLTVPCMTIKDKPAFRTRGYYLDVTRGRVPTMDWLKSWVDRLCLYKYNQFQLYIEHTFKFDGLSEVWRGSDPLTASDILELDSYCAARGIELVPSVSTFGHHYTALRTQSLRELGEFPEDADRPFSFIERMKHHTLNITHERSYGFATSLIDELMPLFRSRKFNICADETFDLGKGESRQEAAKRGIGTMYADFVGRLCRHVEDHGHRVMMWADVALEHPEIISMLSENVTWLNWQYEPDTDDSKVATLARSGATQIVCPAVWCWNALIPRIDDAWNNISRMAAYGHAHGTLGMLVTDWGDFGHVNDPRMSIPGMIIGAQQAWNPDAGLSEPDMLSRISKIEYGDRSGRLVDMLRAASAASSFSWSDLVTYIELDDGHGGCNPEIVRATDSLKSYRGRLSQSIPPNLQDARASMLRTLYETIAQCEANNTTLEQCSEHLASVFCTVRRPSTAAIWRLAFEGQQLLNDVGLALSVAHGVTHADEIKTNPAKLANELECWMERYSQAWHEVSRQSELARIQHVVWSTADILRSI